MKLRLSLVLIGLFAGTVHVPEAHAQIGGELRIQGGFGGDAIATVEYSDGSDSDLKLGTYFAILAGPSLELWTSGPNAIELQGLVGWAGWSTGPENTDDRLSLNRFPLEALLFYGHRFPGGGTSIRIGGGVAYHVINDVSGSGSLEGTEVGVENAAGPVAEAAVQFGIISAGLRYTQMDNTVQGVPTDLSGSSFGIFVGITTPRS